MNQLLWNSVGQIGDDLICGAGEESVKNHFGRRIKLRRVIYGGVAAGLCFVVFLSTSIFFRPVDDVKNKEESFKKEKGIDISGPETEDSLSNPAWAGILAHRLRVEKSEYLPAEQPVLELSYGLMSGALGGGTLRIVIDPGDFTAGTGTVFTFPGYIFSSHSGREADSLSVTLTPKKADASGSVTISFLFYPDDEKTFLFAEYLRSGALELGKITLSYVIDGYEIVFSP